MKKQKTAVIVGRFQAPYLHDGHKGLIEFAQKNYERVLVLVGVAPTTSKENPLNFKMRKSMIMSTFDKIFVTKINDVPDDKEWVNKVVSTAVKRFKSSISDLVFLGGRDSCVDLLEKSGYEVERVSFDLDHISATEIRKRIVYNDSTKGKTSFRAGVIHAYQNQFPRINPTVDIAIINKKSRTLVFGKRASETKVRFIGGFVDMEDPSYERSAVRELKEEANIEVPLEDMKYLGSFKSIDWRYKGSNSIVTSLFYVIVEDSGAPGDDIDELVEIPFDQINSIDIMPEHATLLQCLKDHLNYKDILNKI